MSGALDHGVWDYFDWYDGRYYTDYYGPDGHMDYAYEHSVGPLYTKDVYIYIRLPT